MPLTDILTPQSVLASVKAVSKKQLLQELSAFAAAHSDLSESDIYEALLQRERLGSTGIGHGIAIPHGKLPKLNRLIGIFARLEKPVDFDALDGQQVDLVFLLLAPEGAGADHLKALSRVARALRDPAIAQKLRKSHDASALFSLLTQAPTATAA
jgi:PTS system nitrogen regulatory IIA component